MLQARVPDHQETQTTETPPESVQQIISSTVGLFARQYPAMILTLLICVGLAGVYLVVAPNKYTATAALLIDSRKLQGLQTQGAMGNDAPVDSAMVDSQAEILKSESIATNVIKDLHLTNTAEFGGEDGATKASSSDLNPSDPAMRIAVAIFQGKLTIKRLLLSYVIEISFTSLSPERSAQIANAIAEGYIVDSLESKYQASRRAAVWLQDRMKELRAQASTAERAVAEYKASNNIVDAGGRLLTEQQLAEINSALTIARAQRSDAEAKLARITSILKSDDNDKSAILNDLATVADTMQNPIITKLRQSYLEDAAKESDWAVRYGPTHLAVVNLRNQMREIRHSITDELRRTAESYKSDLEIAKSREEAGQKRLNDTIALSNDTSQAQIVLRDLESNAQSARALADNFLQLYMVSVQQQSFPITEARVITQATTPLRKSAPKTLIVLAAAFIAGSMLAVLVGALRDMMDRVFRTSAQVEAAFRTGCLATIPDVGLAKRSGGLLGQLPRSLRHSPALTRLFGNSPPSAPSAASNAPPTAPASIKKFGVVSGRVLPPEDRVLASNDSVARNVVNTPFSRFAEAIRSVKLATDLGNFGSAVKIIGLTSALPNEGKSTVSEALALVVAQSGSRTLLIDGDIRNPSLTATLTPNAELGLIDLVLGKSDLKDVIWIDPQTNLHFLPCVASRFSNSGDILASQQMEKLFQHLREQYDRIILDLSPLAPVIDVRATGALVDSYMLVIEWGKAKVDIVNRVLNDAPIVRERMLGAVLNKVDIAAMHRYDVNQRGYYHNAYYKRYGYVD